jgi:hypothetical protein
LLKFFTSCFDLPSFAFINVRPEIPAPRVIEIKFARTAKEMIAGIEVGLNQLVARIDGEFKIKTLPIDAKVDPAKHQKIVFSYIRVLIQIPATSNAPPIQHPIFIPNLSRIQLTGNAQTGCKIGKINILSVTKIGS